MAIQVIEEIGHGLRSVESFDDKKEGVEQIHLYN